MNASEKPIDPAGTSASSSSSTPTVRQITSNISGGDSFEQQYLTMEGTQQPKQNLLL